MMSSKLTEQERGKLTNVELSIVKLTAEGLTNVEIAKQLNFSVITIKKYLSRIYEKLGLEGKRQLVIYALKNNLF